MPANITAITALIHPDYLDLPFQPAVLGSSSVPINQKQIDLHTLWEEDITALSQRPNEALFYFSYLTQEQLAMQTEQQGVSRRGLVYYHHLDTISDAREQINKYSQLLGDRFILFTREDDLPSRETVGQRLGKIQLEPQDRLSMRVYGITRELCATSWGSHLQRTLGIKARNFHVEGAKSLSMTEIPRLVQETHDWRAQRRK